MSETYCKVMRVLLIILVISTLILCIVAPFLLIFVVLEIIGIVSMTKRIGQIKKDKEEQNRIEKMLLERGYKKIYDNIFINEDTCKLNIMNQDYGFSDIIDCEIIENEQNISNTYGQTNGRIKSNNKIKARTNSYATQIEYCSRLAIKMTIQDLNNPNIIIDIIKYNVNKNSKKYAQLYSEAQRILSVFKVIISKNKEKYIENGTITKIEHRYINEETAEDKIKKLSELYKEGILTEYEFVTKKMELLEKLNKQ